MNNAHTRRAALLLLLVVALIMACLLAGCVADPLVNHTTNQIYSSDQEYAPILPASDKSVSDTRTATLYFRYLDEQLLSTESREITMPQDKRIEECIIEQLIAGPSADHSELTAIMPENTRLLNVEYSADLLFITLSKEFLEAPAAAPINWESDSYWSIQLPARRRLALDAIACAITDLGEYSQVQLLVDSDNEGDALPQRVPRYYFYSDAPRDESALMGGVNRNEQIVLTPRTMLREVMISVQAQDWTRLYTFISEYDGAGQPRPVLESFVNEMAARDCSLLSYAIGDAMVANDGQQATVCMDMTLSARAGDNAYTAFPISLVRQSEAWKITYPTLARILKP